MIRLLYKTWFQRFSHPRNEELLQFLDGELCSRKSRRIDRHLRTCWHCRTRRERVERFVGAFIEQRNGVLWGHTAFPSRSLNRFETRAEDLGKEIRPTAQALHSRLLDAVVETHSQRLKTALVVLLAVSMLVVWQRLDVVSVVSARELVQRCQKAEFERLTSVQGAVVYQKLHARRRSQATAREDSVAWEVWHDTRRARIRHRMEWGQTVPIGRLSSKLVFSGLELPAPSAPPVLLELQKVLETNRLSWLEPLSPATYRAWTDSLREKTQVVKPTTLYDGQHGLRLATVIGGSSESGAVLDSEWVVRTKDWHPVQHRIRVQGQAGLQTYEVTELAYDVIPPSSLPSSLFAEVESSGASPSRKLPPALSFNGPRVEDLMAAEVKAHYALHRLKACLGEPIEVVRGLGEVEVRGLARDGERKAELLAAISAIPLVAAKIETIDEAKHAGTLESRSSAASLTEEIPEIAPQPEATRIEDSHLPIQAQLEEYFKALTTPRETSQATGGAREVYLKIAELSNRAVSLSEGMLAEAWALRRLSESYSDKEKTELQVSSKWLLESMVRDHIEALSREVSQTRSLLGPILLWILEDASSSRTTQTEPVSKDPAASTGDAQPSWNASALTLFGRLDSARGLIQGLFASGGLSTSREEAVWLLWSEISGFEAVLKRLEIQVVEEFSEPTKGVSLSRR